MTNIDQILTKKHKRLQKQVFVQKGMSKTKKRSACGSGQRSKRDLGLPKRVLLFTIHINNDMNINIHIDINMNMDIHIIINMNIEDCERYHLSFIRYSLFARHRLGHQSGLDASSGLNSAIFRLRIAFPVYLVFSKISIITRYD